MSNADAAMTEPHYPYIRQALSPSPEEIEVTCRCASHEEIGARVQSARIRVGVSPRVLAAMMADLGALHMTARKIEDIEQGSRPLRLNEAWVLTFALEEDLEFFCGFGDY